MAVGIGLGKASPGLAPALDAMKLDTVSLPIAIGLLWMMYPVLARVSYEKIPAMAGNTKLLITSLALNSRVFQPGPDAKDSSVCRRRRPPIRYVWSHGGLEA
jgi:ACR3 family arsenite efflux pump ArsB